MLNQYILILLWVGLLALLQSRVCRVEYDRLTDSYQWKVAPWFAVLAVVPLIWMATNRGYIGDTAVYIGNYLSAPLSLSEIPAYLVTRTKDTGFYLLTVLLRLIIGANYRIYLFIIASLHAIGVTRFFRKYSTNFFFSVFLFIASTDYISWMFNGIRQFMVVIIILWGTGLMLNEKKQNYFMTYTKLFLLIAMSSTMHQSALMMIPFVLIAQGEAWNKRTILFILLALLAVVFVDRFTDFLDDALQATQYNSVVSDYTSWGDDGTNPIRVLVYAIPAIFSFMGRRQIQGSGSVLIKFCTNMSIISTGLYLISMVTSGIFIGRLPIYCSLFGYILLPWEIEHIFDLRSRKLVWGAAVLGYLGFYYYQMHVTFGLF